MAALPADEMSLGLSAPPAVDAGAQATAGEIVIAEELDGGSGRFCFGLRSLFLLTTICAVQFAVM